MAAEPWVVWSNEHMAWWRANNRGYCTDIRGAGIYTEAEAKACEPLRSEKARNGKPAEVAMSLRDAITFDTEYARPMDGPTPKTVGELWLAGLADSERKRDLEALHEARAEMDRCCFGPEVADQDGYEKAEKQFDALYEKLWPSERRTSAHHVDGDPR